ncbi:LPS assembly lipoprotein LptE [Pantoea vagans]|uniref:LPS assembly lipoprotein LptE n=1 Tax=Pantoea vagans TaxID=470934 RepID=UPI00320B45B7
MELYIAFLCLKSVIENPPSLQAALALDILRVLSRHSATLIIRSAYLMTAVLLCGCGFHRHGLASRGQKISVILITPDPYGPYARAVRRELRLDGVNVLRAGKYASANTVRVVLVSSSVGSDTASVFINGSTAEYEMVLDARVSITLPGCMPVSISIRPHKLYINYTSGALAIDAAKEVYTEEMYQQAAIMISRRVVAGSDTSNTCQRAS